MTVSGALVASAFVIFLFAMGVAVWVVDESRGRDWRRWHRPLVVLLCAVAGLVAIAAAWMEVDW